MHIRNFVCLLLAFLLACSQLHSQQRISGNYQDITLYQVFRDIESKTPYRFFYDEQLLDSVKIQATANAEFLETFLRKIFRNSDVRFAIDSDNRVFISYRKAITTKLPANFFEGVQGDSTGGDAETWDDNEVNSEISAIENRLIQIGSGTGGTKSRATVNGYVRDSKTGEAISGASVYLDTPAVAVVTDQYGYYSLPLRPGRYTIRISSGGMKDTRRQVQLLSDGRMDVEMTEYVASLREVIVVSDRVSNIRGLQLGTDRLSIKTIKKVPVVFGEADVLKVVLSLPGVTSAGEASTGINVRGGSADQNLILLNDATIYNPSHLFGFFSAFNPDIVKGVELYKASIPESYGGRLSSVLDVSVREGNTKKFTGTGGIGPLTSKLTLEGPLIKDRSSFIVSGRTTYSNWILSQVPNKSYSNSRASFNDLSMHISHVVDKKNQLFVTGYMSNDHFKLNGDTSFRYGNRNANIKWKHNFNNRMYGVFTAGIDQYHYSISSEGNPVNAYSLDFSLRQLNLKADFNYTLSDKHHFTFGFANTYYTIQPGKFEPKGQQSLVRTNTLAAEQASESAVYFGDKYQFNSNLSLKAGLRYSVFNRFGPGSVRSYAPGLPRTNENVRDSSFYNSGKVVNTYHGPEFRLALQYLLSENASVKLGYNSMRQYIHMLSNTLTFAPTDIWKLSDPHIRPQIGEQFSAGLYKNFRSNTIETSVEVYYKRMKNFLDFKSGAQLLMNPRIETDVLSTRGKAYGLELLVKKNSGKLNGWISYTYSRTLLKMDDPLAGESINDGNFYPANFDRPHNANMVANFRFSHRYSISMNVVYNTGRPITLPIASFDQAGAPRLYYSDRNRYRIPDYFRTDFSVNIEGNHRQKQRIHNSWSFGAYNITARENPYSVFFVQENGSVKGYQLSIFGTIIPFVTYNFRF